MKASIAALLASAIGVAACGSEYTNIDTTRLEVSPNMRVSAQSLVPNAERFPVVVQKLALAEELYQQQSLLLKQRRNKVRARRRSLGMLSYVTFGATAAGISSGAILIDDQNSSKTMGVAAVTGLALGGAFQIAGLMQEDTDAVDQKVARLTALHQRMLDTLRLLGERASQPVDPAHPVDLTFEMSRTIEDFIDAAHQINVKG